jgi:hypothetical protein
MNKTKEDALIDIKFAKIFLKMILVAVICGLIIAFISDILILNNFIEAMIWLSVLLGTIGTIGAFYIFITIIANLESSYTSQEYRDTIHKELLKNKHDKY